MKILISDYDGTYRQDYKNPKGIYKNNECIRNFMEKGNIFAFATARSFLSIKSEIEKYNIPYNYLICNDGLFIIDEKNNVLHEKLLDKNTIEEIKDLVQPLSYKISLNDKYGNEKNINILEIIAFLKFGQDSKKIINTISNMELHIQKYWNNLYIKSQTDKSLGIQLLMNHINQDAEIHTIGDNSNDLAMLKAFKGHKVITCYPMLYGKGIDTSLSVRSLVKKL